MPRSSSQALDVLPDAARHQHRVRRDRRRGPLLLLGDRAALTSVENFYQRILAGDPNEARDHAETLLKDRPLVAYYDDVALKGLQLAANDVQRGVLAPEKAA